MRPQHCLAHSIRAADEQFEGPAARGGGAAFAALKKQTGHRASLPLGTSFEGQRAIFAGLVPEACCRRYGLRASLRPRRGETASDDAPVAPNVPMLARPGRRLSTIDHFTNSSRPPLAPLR